MTAGNRSDGTRALFETRPVWSALAVMALPTIASQLVTLIYNLADTWYIGRTDNPYMVAASSLVEDCVFPFSHPENEIAEEMQIKAHKATLESFLNLFVFIFCFLSGLYSKTYNIILT